MTVRYSTGLRNLLTQAAGFSGIFNRGRIEVYSGSQPATADAQFTGTVLGTVGASSVVPTKETRATGTIVITGGSVSVATVTVGTFNIIPDGAVAYNTSTAQTASDLADAINRNGIFEASVVSSTVTIKPRPGVGDAYNGLTLTSTGSVTATYGGGTVAGGVDPANGLYFGPPAAGVLAKATAQIWSMAGVAIGTAGWFRLYSSDSNDSGALISAAPYYPRLDGSIGVGTGDLQLSSLAVTSGSPHTIDSFTWTQPAS